MLNFFFNGSELLFLSSWLKKLKVVGIVVVVFIKWMVLLGFFLLKLEFDNVVIL